MEKPLYSLHAHPQTSGFEGLFEAIDRLLAEKPRVLVAIDGHCASGKTTLAALLEQVYGCPVIPMDHFFLRPEQRTPERLATPGGNVDHERFKEEVLKPLKEGRPFSYRPFSCRTMALEEGRDIRTGDLVVVEGSYSLHPELAEAYDLAVFLSVDPEEQIRRIRERNGEEMAGKFESLWIPMEHKYFAAFGIKEACGLRFDTTTRREQP